MKSQSCFHICYNQNLHFSASLQHDRNLKICHFSKLKPIKKNISISFMEYKWTFANKIQLIYFNLIILKRITCWYWLIFFFLTKNENIYYCLNYDLFAPIYECLPAMIKSQNVHQFILLYAQVSFLPRTILVFSFKNTIITIHKGYSYQ